MADAGELYTAEILAHNRRPHNRGMPAAANRRAEGDNPQCGDKLTLYLDLRGGVIQDAGFEGSACAIAVASASLLTDALKGLTVERVEDLLGGLDEMFSAAANDGWEGRGLRGLEILAGVRRYPARMECASLAWHTLARVLEEAGAPT
jgi:SUF system NifU family Fe-S assembly protein